MITPNTVLMTTAEIATITVSFKAWTVSASENSSPNVSQFWNVFVATSETGQATSRNRYTTTTSRSAQRNAVARGPARCGSR
ncbi:hypothetical protein ACE2AJ_19180 [Aquihabitans daechungensis]|uniref:hypothetical protein n=1 Tax=Aquihabitans daechungensis TaxID=1052257 RepID=UPI003BA0330E